MLAFRRENRERWSARTIRGSVKDTSVLGSALVFITRIGKGIPPKRIGFFLATIATVAVVVASIAPRTGRADQQPVGDTRNLIRTANQAPTQISTPAFPATRLSKLATLSSLVTHLE
jgi:hypothetical protein